MVVSANGLRLVHVPKHAMLAFKRELDLVPILLLNMEVPNVVVLLKIQEYVKSRIVLLTVVYLPGQHILHVQKRVAKVLQQGHEHVQILNHNLVGYSAKEI